MRTKVHSMNPRVPQLRSAMSDSCFSKIPTKPWFLQTQKEHIKKKNVCVCLRVSEVRRNLRRLRWLLACIKKLFLRVKSWSIIPNPTLPGWNSKQISLESIETKHRNKDAKSETQTWIQHETTSKELWKNSQKHNCSKENSRIPFCQEAWAPSKVLPNHQPRNSEPSRSSQ